MDYLLGHAATLLVLAGHNLDDFHQAVRLSLLVLHAQGARAAAAGDALYAYARELP